MVEGCFIGTNNAGAAAAGNKFHGVLISGAATNVRIGGTTAAARNIISGNFLRALPYSARSTSANKVLGNFIGTAVNGTTDMGNALDGVLIGGGSKNNVIGGTDFKARNVISGNDANGVNIQDAGTNGNKVQGNYVGLQANGNTALATPLTASMSPALQRRTSSAEP